MNIYICKLYVKLNIYIYCMYIYIVCIIVFKKIIIILISLSSSSLAKELDVIPESKVFQGQNLKFFPYKNIYDLKKIEFYNLYN